MVIQMDILFPDSNLANLINLILTAANALISVIGVAYDIASGLSEKKKSEETRVEQNYTYEDRIMNIPDKLSQKEKDPPQQSPKA